MISIPAVFFIAIVKLSTFAPACVLISSSEAGIVCQKELDVRSVCSAELRNVFV